MSDDWLMELNIKANEVDVVWMRCGNYVMVVLEMKWMTGGYGNVLNSLDVAPLPFLCDDKWMNHAAVADVDDLRNIWRREDVDDGNYTHVSRDE